MSSLFTVVLSYLSMSHPQSLTNDTYANLSLLIINFNCYYILYQAESKNTKRYFKDIYNKVSKSKKFKKIETKNRTFYYFDDYIIGIYIYIYIYIFTYICIYTYIYIYICIYIQIDRKIDRQIDRYRQIYRYRYVCVYIFK